jgi:NAD(P)H-hydrate epimerase
MIDSERMGVVDHNAAALGVSLKQLMESSGNAVAREVREVASAGDSVAVVAGRGNNGGDGLVAARFLGEMEITVHLLGRAPAIKTEIARENWETLVDCDATVHEVTGDLALGDPDVVVDAMLGTGVTGALRDPERSAAERVNTADATVVAVDVPSGVDADTGDAVGVAVDADRVVTFHDQKPGLADRDDVTVADIGIPAAAERLVGPGDRRVLDRPADGHKGDFGRVLVVGGGPYAGAPALTALAALRAGADLAFVACPEQVAEAVQGYTPDLIVDPLPGDRLEPRHVPELINRVAERDIDAVVLGPGLGGATETREAVAAFLGEYGGRAVVDADALAVVPELATDATLLCTPHRGELREMGGPGVEDPDGEAEKVAAFAADLGATLLVKGPHDAVTDGETTRVNRTGNPGMTVGGTGDVLAGVCGALLSVQAPVTAGALAAYATGAAGDRVVEERGHGLLASDLPEHVSEVLWRD